VSDTGEMVGVIKTFAVGTAVGVYVGLIVAVGIKVVFVGCGLGIGTSDIAS